MKSELPAIHIKVSRKHRAGLNSRSCIPYKSGSTRKTQQHSQYKTKYPCPLKRQDRRYPVYARKIKCGMMTFAVECADDAVSLNAVALSAGFECYYPFHVVLMPHASFPHRISFSEVYK